MDLTLKARLEARLDGYLRMPIYQRHDETEIRIDPGVVPEVLSILHDSRGRWTEREIGPTAPDQI